MEFLFWAGCGKHRAVTAYQSSHQQGLRRIGVLGDIHCEEARLVTALEFFQSQHLDLLCAVGDLVDGPGDPNRTIQLLLEHQVLCVRGNHERWLMAGEMREMAEASVRAEVELDTWEFLDTLPLTRKLSTVAGTAMLCHGLGLDDMAGVWPRDDSPTLHANYALWQLVNRREYQFVINGHTHQRLVRSFGELTIINAGTLLYKHSPCCCLIDFAAGWVQYFNLPGKTKLEPAERFALPPKTLI